MSNETPFVIAPERRNYNDRDMVLCYVLVRIDAPDFNFGKACAQTHHNGTQMTEDYLKKNFPALNDLYDEWQVDIPAEMAAFQASEDLVSAQVRKADEEVIEVLTRIATETRAKADSLRRTFGTVYTLAVTAAEMRQAVSLAQLHGLHAGITHDPTYPIRDGDRFTTAPVDTGAYVFGRKSACKPAVGTFDLLSDKHLPQPR